MPENKTHRGNYAGSTNMNAENQSMEFVNDTLENAPNAWSLNVQKDDLNEGREDKQVEFEEDL